jgi:hypothetical protein
VVGAVVVSGAPPVGSSQQWPLDGDVGEVYGQLNAGLQHRQELKRGWPGCVSPCPPLRRMHLKRALPRAVGRHQPPATSGHQRPAPPTNWLPGLGEGE